MEIEKYNRYEYIRKRSRDLARLCWMSQQVSIDYKIGSISVSMRHGSIVHEYMFSITPTFQKVDVDKRYINTHLKKLCFDLIEECFAEKDKEE